MYNIIDNQESKKIINVTTGSDIHEFTDNIENKQCKNHEINTFQLKNAIYIGKSSLYMHKIIDKRFFKSCVLHLHQNTSMVLTS